MDHLWNAEKWKLKKTEKQISSCQFWELFLDWGWRDTRLEYQWSNYLFYSFGYWECIGFEEWPFSSTYLHLFAFYLAWVAQKSCEIVAKSLIHLLRQTAVKLKICLVFIAIKNLSIRKQTCQSFKETSALFLAVSIYAIVLQKERQLNHKQTRKFEVINGDWCLHQI